ncbi:ATP-binding protein [Puteibacter caeruleilacunae]|nr:ATP-binding protein [Puteibacter caeruleilacunae]
MRYEIIIPNPGSDEMGASFNSLFVVLGQLDTITINDELIINLQDLSFVHPFLVLPICCFLDKVKQQNVRVDIINVGRINNYLETIFFPQGFNSLAYDEWKQFLLSFRHKTYLPICQIPVAVCDLKMREDLLTSFENILLEQLRITGQMVSVVKYLMGEAIDNIVDHAKVEGGWIMVQNYPKKGYMDICILDGGLGILGSYQTNQISGVDDDVDALEHAVNGNSTKKITETRGYGIDTSRRMLVDGLKGKYVLFSGAAFYVYTNELEQIISLDRNIKWHGTMLALRIPCDAPEGFNYAMYLE